MYGKGKDLDICYMCVKECKKAPLADDPNIKADRSCFVAHQWTNKSGLLGGVVYTTPRN